MLLSPLQLDSYFFEELHFLHDTAFDAKEKNLNQPLPIDALQVDVDRALHPTDARRRFYRLRLELPASDGKFSCSLRAVVVGYFTILEECQEERLDVLADANAPALLYGVAREALAALSGRGPLPPVTLPAVHFLDFTPPNLDDGNSAAESKKVTGEKKQIVKTAKKPRKSPSLKSV